MTRTPALLIGLLAVIAGCSATAPPPSGVPTPSTSPPAPSAAVTPAVDPAATPLPSITATADVPLDAVTLVCESWGSEPPAETIACREAASLALTAIGPEQAATVDRLNVGFGERCPSTPCPNRRPDVGWVVARSADGSARLMKVARAPTGELAVWPPVAGDPPAVPAFDPPARAAADLGADAPVALRDREAYPFCGDEDLGPSEAFDVAARRCFVDGVLSGSPVELLSRSVSTEGDPVVTLYRFAGHGSVVRSVRAGGGWATAVCGLSPIATPAAFVMAGGCDPREL